MRFLKNRLFLAFSLLVAIPVAIAACSSDPEIVEKIVEVEKVVEVEKEVHHPVIASWSLSINELTNSPMVGKIHKSTKIFSTNDFRNHSKENEF